MSEGTYTNRYREAWIIAKIEDSAWTNVEGWTTACPDSLRGVVAVGDEVTRESVGSSLGRTTGWLHRGTWFERRTDQQIEAEHAAMVASIERKNRERLETKRSEWIGRTENLPGWLQERIQTFRERGGDKFEVDGWGYELVVCELAALYAKHPDVTSGTPWNDLPQEIRDYDERVGCSGNQHGMASALARAHRDGQSIAGTVSALSPLTGDAFYEGKP